MGVFGWSVSGSCYPASSCESRGPETLGSCFRRNAQQGTRHDPDTLHPNAHAKPSDGRRRTACAEPASTPAFAGAGKLRMSGVGKVSSVTEQAEERI